MRRSQARARLLRQVGGSPHATADDHDLNDTKFTEKAETGDRPSGFKTLSSRSVAPKAETKEALASRQDDEEDFDREPESSGDEQEAVVQGHEVVQVQRQDDKENAAGQKLKSAGGFRKLGSSKRMSSQEDTADSNVNDDDDDDGIFGSSQGSPKRRKVMGSGFVNLLAPEPGLRRLKALPQKYGRAATAPKPAARKFRKSTGAVQPAEKVEVVLPFKKLRSKIAQVSNGDDIQQDEVDADAEASADEELPGVLGATCPMCGESIDTLVLEEFADTHLRGRRMTFAWQKRFCQHHRIAAARATWKERGYPDIDWNSLDARMQKHDAFLLRVLNGSTPSHYRTEMRARLQPGSKGVAQSFHSGRPGASAGYYGPRGEKAMTDHILNHYAAQIRRRAAQDELVAQSGVAGGVSGFVHAVLVPHLAEQLVREDMQLPQDDDADVRRLIVESAELGELLHPEAEDRVEVQSEDESDTDRAREKG